jgi:hypothetical protein
VPAEKRWSPPRGKVRLAGYLTVPQDAPGIVVFAHGSGSSRHSPRNRHVARVLTEGGWLPPDKSAGLLRCYGILLAELTPVRSEREAARAFEAAAGPVVLKADVPGLVHKTDALDLNPVIARPDGAFVVDARVKVAPYAPQDPLLRKLR